MSTQPAPKSARQAQEEQKRQVLEALLNRLDAQAVSEAGVQRRRSERVHFRQYSVPVRVHHPGGSIAVRRVLTRDISAGGLSFLHNGYLHLNTRLDVVLRRTTGGKDLISGTVAYCSHIGGTWHLVGARLERRIFPKLYVDTDQMGLLPEEPRDPASLTGTILHMESLELDQRLLAHHLRHTNVAVRNCANVAEAVPLLNSTRFDLVLLNLDLEPGQEDKSDAITPRLRTIQAIRTAGYGGLLAASMNETRPEVITAVRQAGICGLLGKPYEGERVVAALGSWLEGGSGLSAAPPPSASSPHAA